MLTVNEIMERIPHRYPFLLVDRIVDIDRENNKVIGLKNITINEACFQGHFPGHPILPGVLIVEGIAQALGVLVFELAGDDGKDKVPYFAALDEVKFKAPVKPGDQLIYEAQIIKKRRNIIKAEGVAKVDGKVVTEVKFTFSIMDK